MCKSRISIIKHMYLWQATGVHTAYSTLTEKTQIEFYEILEKNVNLIPWVEYSSMKEASREALLVS